jgi:hypothetical protein
MDRYLHSSINEFNHASGGYWRNWERQSVWPVRELIFELIMGNPYYKNEDKPRRKDQIIKLSIDLKDSEEKKVVRSRRLTDQDIKVMEQLNFNK